MKISALFVGDETVAHGVISKKNMASCLSSWRYLSGDLHNIRIDAKKQNDYYIFDNMKQ